MMANSRSRRILCLALQEVSNYSNGVEDLNQEDQTFLNCVPNDVPDIHYDNKENYNIKEHFEKSEGNFEQSRENFEKRQENFEKSVETPRKEKSGDKINRIPPNYVTECASVPGEETLGKEDRPILTSQDYCQNVELNIPAKDSLCRTTCREEENISSNEIIELDVPGEETLEKEDRPILKRQDYCQNVELDIPAKDSLCRTACREEENISSNELISVTPEESTIMEFAELQNVFDSAFNPAAPDVNKSLQKTSPEEYRVEMDLENNMKVKILRVPKKNYSVSPIHELESDVDDSDADPSFDPITSNNSPNQSRMSRILAPQRSSGSDSSESSEEDQSHVVKTRKRLRKPKEWSQAMAKRLRNNGKAYTSVSKTKKYIPQRQLRNPCGEKCRLQCSSKIDETKRQEIFQTYWNLGDISRQRDFLASCSKEINPKYRYPRETGQARHKNHAFYFEINGTPVRVCKVFLKATLDINDRPIRTVISKKDQNGFVEQDLRGKHGKHPTIDEDLTRRMINHINSIPRIESHYLREQTQREYIDGSKTVPDLYRDFKQDQINANKNFGTYSNYLNIFNTKFNIGFFQPRKDQCDLCLSYDNATGQSKNQIKESYDLHLKEKQLSREEKKNDKNEIGDSKKVVIYDLQAVLQSPRGEISSFYYKSKLNSYNFTISELAKKDQEVGKLNSRYANVECFFWDEREGNRGAVEIGSCVLKYLQSLAEREDNETLEVVLYSDNCCGQQKNKYLATAYLYAVLNYKIKKITHKFLIKGHTQNENDTVHSVIEKEINKYLKSGPIYSPQQYVTLIRSAKKINPPYVIYELSHEDFMDLKLLQEEWGNNFSINEAGNTVFWNDIKSLEFRKENPLSFFYKTTYVNEPYQEISLRKKRKKYKPVEDIHLQKAYKAKLPLSQNKKKDLLDLVNKNIIPGFYAPYYQNICNN